MIRNIRVGRWKSQRSLRLSMKVTNGESAAEEELCGCLAGPSIPVGFAGYPRLGRKISNSYHASWAFNLIRWYLYGFGLGVLCLLPPHCHFPPVHACCYSPPPPPHCNLHHAHRAALMRARVGSTPAVHRPFSRVRYPWFRFLLPFAFRLRSCGLLDVWFLPLSPALPRFACRLVLRSLYYLPRTLPYCLPTIFAAVLCPAYLYTPHLPRLPTALRCPAASALRLPRRACLYAMPPRAARAYTCIPRCTYHATPLPVYLLLYICRAAPRAVPRIRALQRSAGNVLVRFLCAVILMVRCTFVLCALVFRCWFAWFGLRALALLRTAVP